MLLLLIRLLFTIASVIWISSNPYNKPKYFFFEKKTNCYIVVRCRKCITTRKRTVQLRLGLMKFNGEYKRKAKAKHLLWCGSVHYRGMWTESALHLACTLPLCWKFKVLEVKGFLRKWINQICRTWIFTGAHKRIFSERMEEQWTEYVNAVTRISKIPISRSWLS